MCDRLPAAQAAELAFLSDAKITLSLIKQFLLCERQFQWHKKFYKLNKVTVLKHTSAVFRKMLSETAEAVPSTKYTLPIEKNTFRMLLYSIC